MSYSIWLEIDTGGPEKAVVCEVGNYTSNVAPMWIRALGHSLGDFHGQRAGECAIKLSDAVAHMTENLDDYARGNPPNGWGDAEGARKYLLTLLRSCHAHPKSTVRIHR